MWHLSQEQKDKNSSLEWLSEATDLENTQCVPEGNKVNQPECKWEVGRWQFLVDYGKKFRYQAKSTEMMTGFKQQCDI